VLPRGKAFADELEALASEDVFIITEHFLRRWFFKTIVRHIESSDQQIHTKVSATTAIEVLRHCCDVIRHQTNSLVTNKVVASTLFRFASITLFTEHSFTISQIFFTCVRVRNTQRNWVGVYGGKLPKTMDI
jgi:hypothetical protein